MTNKTKKYSVIFVTLISAFLFCSLLVAASLSSLADSGPNANQFGSLGMWASIGMVLFWQLGKYRLSYCISAQRNAT